jgi:RimJ/RimL family protein N-acetyltransferase
LPIGLRRARQISKANPMTSHPGTSVRLDPPRKRDIETLFCWANDHDLVLWTARRWPLQYEEFVEHVRRQSPRGTLLVIRDTGTSRAMGFIESARHDRDAVAEFLVYVGRDSRARPAPLLGIARFIDELFVNYPMRKVYCQVYGFNRQSLRLVRHAGFIEEACFHEYTWWSDRYWDLHVFSLTRDCWAAAQSGAGPGAAARRAIRAIEQRLSRRNASQTQSASDGGS